MSKKTTDTPLSPVIADAMRRCRNDWTRAVGYCVDCPLLWRCSDQAQAEIDATTRKDGAK